MKGFQLKNRLPYLKYALRLSCVVRGSIYGRFTGFYVNGFLSCKTRGLHRRDVTHILSKVSCCYWNPFIFVGYRNDFFFPIQILIFRMLRNNAEACRCSYFELGLPLSYLTSVSFCYDLDCLPFPVTNIKNLIEKNHATSFTRPGHPTTISCKISVRRSKNCLEFSIPWGRLKISRSLWSLFHSCTIFEPIYQVNSTAPIFWSLIFRIPLPRLSYFSQKKKPKIFGIENSMELRGIRKNCTFVKL